MTADSKHEIPQVTIDPLWQASHGGPASVRSEAVTVQEQRVEPVQRQQENGFGVFPITVIAAILLFTLKEVLEACRKAREKRREAKAIRALLVRECVKNIRQLSALQRIIVMLSGRTSEESPAKVRVETDKMNNKQIIVTYDVINPVEESSYFPCVTTESLRSHLLKSASVEKDLYNSMQNAYNNLSDARIILENMMLLCVHAEQIELEISMFASHCINDVDKAIQSVQDLHVECTGTTYEFPPEPFTYSTEATEVTSALPGTPSPAATPAAPV